ncbi:MAG: hypothetical protein O6931_00715 [Gammaproteobacteria bacterium]|nr:hypothetical protein [Gammaproteobacteria bacterium]
MVSEDNAPGATDDRESVLRDVTSKALVFGEQSAKNIAPEIFSDPVMHNYFLFFIYGAIDALGDHDRLDEKLNMAEKQATMAEALAAFGTATQEQIVATVKLLERSADEAAIAIKLAGHDAATAWAWGENEEATQRFVSLLEDPANFPREVEQVLAPLDNAADASDSPASDDIDIIK